MTKVLTTMSMSLDGFISGVEDSPEAPLGKGGAGLHAWLKAGDTPSRFYPDFRMCQVSARVFDDQTERVGAIVSGRRTYYVSRGWGGDGPLPGCPLFVATHDPPGDPPKGRAPTTFVTTGVESAIAHAKEVAAASKKDVALMGGSIIHQAFRAGLLDEINIALVPLVLGRGVPLFADVSHVPTMLECTRAVIAVGVTHLSYRVVR